MMYKIIATELKSINLENAHPQDYLNFYCLGHREVPKEDKTWSAVQPSETVVNYINFLSICYHYFIQYFP